MKIFIFVLIFGVCNGITHEPNIDPSVYNTYITKGCRVFAPNFVDPHCGIAEDCYYDGENELKTRNESCRRQELNKDPFTEIRRGTCPSDKPPC